jgi:hypothetical protein
LPASELESCRFVDVESLSEFVIPRMARRLEQAMNAVLNNQTLYLENQLSA